MFRAIRLVVDTGIHAFHWNKQRAIDYMVEVAGMSDRFAGAEVDRYITWPAQACSYKIGELKIKEFREKMSSALGAKFDVKEFHDLVLRKGAVPFYMIEKNIERHIETKKDVKI